MEQSRTYGPNKVDGLIWIALALFQSNPLVGLPAGWGGVIALVTAKGIISLTTQVPVAQPWIIGAIVILAMIGGLFACYRSLALEKPILALRRPTLPRLSLPRPAGDQKKVRETSRGQAAHHQNK